MTAPHRILIADDEPVILSLFQMALTKDPLAKQDDTIDALSEELFGQPKHEHGQPQEYALTCCSQGDEAYEKVQEALDAERPYGTIFIDVRMPPGPDGVTTAERIRKLDPNVQIVIVTGFSDVPPKEIQLRVPPADKLQYIEKPCRIAKIRELAKTSAARWNRSD